MLHRFCCAGFLSCFCTSFCGVLIARVSEVFVTGSCDPCVIGIQVSLPCTMNMQGRLVLGAVPDIINAGSQVPPPTSEPV